MAILEVEHLKKTSEKNIYHAPWQQPGGSVERR